MNNFDNYIVEKIEEYINKGNTYKTLLKDINNIFNLNENKGIEEIFENYCIEIIEYYLEKYSHIFIINYNIKDIIVTIINNLVVQFFETELLNNNIDLDYYLS